MGAALVAMMAVGCSPAAEETTAAPAANSSAEAAPTNTPAPGASVPTASPLSPQNAENPNGTNPGVGTR